MSKERKSISAVAKNSILTTFNTLYGHLLPCNKHAPVWALIPKGFVPFFLLFSAKEHAIRLKAVQGW
jgi:hypothetical protein